MKKIVDQEITGVEKSFKDAGPYLGLGFQFAATIVLLILAGSWLDGRLNTSPWFTAVLGLFGGFAGTYNLIKTVIELGKKQDAAKK
ncbi:MAG: AtpZ/AtpI family protein [Ignavibacteria bacterium]|nr:AtpZ/AtpI family protein [Ignavibacteria bacterium]